jgi:hypothetical protein
MFGMGADFCGCDEVLGHRILPLRGGEDMAEWVFGNES